ncbi:MAG: hypothetical protein GY874_22820 [Desulfobacteraceae bacterium]|nr:hypothetical protein [Desulfobacteraceae bacterium]
MLGKQRFTEAHGRHESTNGINRNTSIRVLRSGTKNEKGGETGTRIKHGGENCLITLEFVPIAVRKVMAQRRENLVYANREPNRKVVAGLNQGHSVPDKSGMPLLLSIWYEKLFYFFLSVRCGRSMARCKAENETIQNGAYQKC